MSLLRPIHIAAIAVPMACVFAACSSASSSGSTSGEGGSGESVGATTVASSGSATAAGTGSGSGGNEGADASTFDAADYCPGDVNAWSKLTADPPACEHGSDCCVIMSACLAQAQIVMAAQKDEATVAWPHCDVDCVDCIPPAIEVGCVGGMCRGRVVTGEAPDSPLRQDHCGDDLKLVDPAAATGVHFGCGG